jgi:ABC-type multidrug transport system ATPase subunit
MAPPRASFETVTVDRVTRVYGVTRALAGVSATFRAGEVASLEGGNGAGKSTLLGILATLARPDGSRRYGVAFIDDVAAAGAPDPLLFANVEAAADGTMRVRDILRLTTSSTVALTGGGAALDG